MELIGKYQIRRELGRGGMAAVYLGFDPRINREVAIKVLPQQFLHDPNFRARFEREAQTIAALEHPAIVPIYDFGEDNGMPFLVMRYMPGGSLAERITAGRLPLAEAAKIVSRIGAALEEAHRKGIVHRDLKPGNILFDHLDNPYLADFGIVKLAAGSNTLTGTGIIGTPAYMSPEQARGRDQLDGRSDIYALGAILFEMLTGKQPYKADTPMGLAVAQMTEPVPQIRQIDSSVPVYVDAVIQRAMAKDRAGRFATAGEMAAALNRPTPPSPRTEPQRAQTTIVDHRASQTVPEQPRPAQKGGGNVWRWIAGALAALLLIGGPLAYLTFFAGEPDPQQRAGEPIPAGDQIAGAEDSPPIPTPVDEASGQEPTPVEPERPPDEETGQSQLPPAEDFSFALVLPAPPGDGGYIDMAILGAQRAINELGVRGTVVETSGIDEHEPVLRETAGAGFDLVLPLGLDSQLIVDVASEFPEQAFGVPADLFVEEMSGNVAAFQIDMHESSFLAGVIAGSMTQTGTVGAILGADDPVLQQFVQGYAQGVLEACGDCQVVTNDLGFNFDDPALGSETASAQFDQGADIIFQIAGRSGDGVIAAAAETGRFAIGVDAPQDDVAPGTVIVSVIKRVDTTTFALIEQAAAGNFAGGLLRVGLEEGATGLSWDEGVDTFAREGPAALTEQLPQVQARVDEYRGRILRGEYAVCDALEPGPGCQGVAAGGGSLTIWAEASSGFSLEKTAEQFTDDTGVEVIVETIDLENDETVIFEAVARREAPDIVVGSHALLYRMAAEGLLAPIDLSEIEGRYIPGTIEAMVFEGDYYGLPYAYENVALIANNNFSGEFNTGGASVSWEQHVASAYELIRLEPELGLVHGLMLPSADFEYMIPVISAYGGFLFGTNDDGTYNPIDVGLDDPKTIEAVEFLFNTPELTIGSDDGSSLIEYTGERATTIVIGRWAMSEINGMLFPPIFRDVPINRTPAAPFLDVYAFMIPVSGEKRDLAADFLLNYVNETENMVDMATVMSRPPANMLALNRLPEGDKKAFGEFGRFGQPRPVFDGVEAVWPIWEEVVARIREGVSVEAAMRDAAEQIRTTVR